MTKHDITKTCSEQPEQDQPEQNQAEQAQAEQNQAEQAQAENLEEATETLEPQRDEQNLDVRQSKDRAQNSDVKSRREKVRAVFGNIGFGLCVAVLICSVALLVFALFMRNTEQKTGIGGYGLFEVLSGSMEPEIKVGDVIIGKRVNSVSELAADGSMNIIFEYDGKTVIHKLIAIEGTTLTTHGIANPVGSNETIDFSRVIAVQKGRIPALGYVLDFVREPYGYIIIVALPLIGVIVYETRKIVKTLKDEKAGGDCAVVEVGSVDAKAKGASDRLENRDISQAEDIAENSRADDSATAAETREIAALKAERDELLEKLNANSKSPNGKA